MLFRSDRKSTRLNSSHTIISYAVFCLKKKKQLAADSVRGRRCSYPTPRWSRERAGGGGARTRRDDARGRDLGTDGRGDLFFFKYRGAPAVHRSPPPRASPH